ncbi:hypothetical protein JCM10207_000659 [Rhodosporidiobolus poonsookiae]
MAIQQPPLPAVPDYPAACPFEPQIEAAYQRFLKELDSPESGWQPAGERDGVKLARKYDEAHANPVPLSRGECVVEDVTPEAFLAGVVQLPGMRSLWDARTEVGYMIERYDRNTVLFYALTKGKRFLANPRDMVGIQRNYADGDTRMIVQTSVDTDKVPPQKGTTRATLKLSGWYFKPEGTGTRIIYILDVALNGQLPSAIVSMAASESPRCAGRARDIYYEYGHAPFVRLPPTPDEPTLIFQLESISTLPKREYRCSITTGKEVGDTFDIVYDLKRMYKPEGGVQVTVEGDGGITVKDDGKGIVRVTTVESGKTTTIVLNPK